MKNIFLYLVIIILAGCSSTKKSIEISNTGSFDRNDEIIEIKDKEFLQLFEESEEWILKNNHNEEVAYQLIKNENGDIEAFIFQVSVPTNKKVAYYLKKGNPSPVIPKTFARFVPERKDDFAWENDLAAYRMYGPALAAENPSNGVDLWLKRTKELIVDTFYFKELQKGQSYHVDHGKGLDCYKVGHTLGAGGIAPFWNDSLWVGNFFNRYEIHYVGPLQSKFSLFYDSIKVGDKFYQEKLTITVSAGALLNKAEVTFTGEQQLLPLAAGIFLHENTGKLSINKEKGIAAYCEDAVSDAKVPSGRNYVGVFVPAPVKEAMVKNNHALLVSEYQPGNTFIYYFGGGWNKWGFPTDDDWISALNRFAESYRSPLAVLIK
ncbi:MAG TPA: DUF4861 family protein [Paludibacteraceae bacterium]|jgi:hypothetical protein|nr:DUF4861 domain-containing protein [Bacteroidales bacterium]HOH55235.1 DUF4861 family protein [Paludibacteraceae bacterium]